MKFEGIYTLVTPPPYALPTELKTLCIDPSDRNAGEAVA